MKMVVRGVTLREDANVSVGVKKNKGLRINKKYVW